MTTAIGVLAPSHAPAGSLADQISAHDATAGDAVRRVEPLLSPAGSITRQLPVDPQQAVIDRTAELSAAMGFPQDPTLQFRMANLPDEIAGRLAIVVQDLLACNAITQRHYSELRGRMEEIAATGGGLSSDRFADIDECGLRLWTSTTELEQTLAAPSNPLLCSRNVGGFVDVWPVLAFDGACVNNVYQNDYLLIVDEGGNDTYANNAGSNMVDLNFAPPTSLVPGLRGIAPARGCQRAIPGLAAGDCVPAAAVVLDMAGDDTFGVKQTPDHDRGCTNDLVVRRMVTIGVGFLGVGILRDAGDGWDRYTGKTGAVGAGHIFGMGILSDSGGNDTYSAVRNSQGFALVGGVGILNDQGGNDSYGFYMPTPLNPFAQNQQEGAGGVRDDEGEGLCDRIPRFTLGAANVLPGTLALFLDDSGFDSYRGAFAGFVAPAQVPSTQAGSLGFGNNQGIGVFVDRAGIGEDDSYVVDGEPGCAMNKLEFSTRDNGVILPPGIECTGEGGGIGMFVDN